MEAGSVSVSVFKRNCQRGHKDLKFLGVFFPFSANRWIQKLFTKLLGQTKQRKKNREIVFLFIAGLLDLDWARTQ